MSKPVCNNCWSEETKEDYHQALTTKERCQSPTHRIGAFVVGATYQTKEGLDVKIVEESFIPGYECVKGDDDIWRYNRSPDRGRCTGSNFDGSCPRNLIPSKYHKIT